MKGQLVFLFQQKRLFKTMRYLKEPNRTLGRFEVVQTGLRVTLRQSFGSFHFYAPKCFKMHISLGKSCFQLWRLCTTSSPNIRRHTQAERKKWLELMVWRHLNAAAKNFSYFENSILFPPDDKLFLA